MKPLLKKHDANSIGLIGHTIVNYPTEKDAQEAVAIMVEEGVDLIELQIPFSEPVADGPLFMEANHEAIAAGVTVTQCFDFMRKVSQQYPTPFVFMSYANIIYKKGFENFVKSATAAGAKGAIVPDLPLENAAEYLAVCQQQNFAAIQIVPPNTDDKRIQLLTHAAHGFIYAVARSGVTGAKTAFNHQLIDFIQRIRSCTELPIAIGFGISSAEDVRFLKPYADYAIVGSQALRILKEQGLDRYRQFWHELKQAAQ